MTVSANRSASLKLETEHGQTVPTIVNGTRVQVKQGNTEIAAGVFSIVPPPPPQGTPTPPATPIARFFRARLDGNSVNPPVTTTGRGTAIVTLNNDSTQIEVDVTYFDLLSEQTVATINGPVANDNLNGPSTSYYENGSMKAEGNFKDNKETGEWKEFNEQGKLAAAGRYNEGLKTGAWKFYDENGNLTRTETYNAAGQLQSTKSK